MPYVVAALLIGWTAAYGRRARREGERLAAAQAINAHEPAEPAETELTARTTRAAIAVR